MTRSSFSSWSSRSNEIKWFWSFLGSQLLVQFSTHCICETVPTSDMRVGYYFVLMWRTVYPRSFVRHPLFASSPHFGYQVPVFTDAIFVSAFDKLRAQAIFNDEEDTIAGPTEHEGGVRTKLDSGKARVDFFGQAVRRALDNITAKSTMPRAAPREGHD